MSPLSSALGRQKQADFKVSLVCRVTFRQPEPHRKTLSPQKNKTKQTKIRKEIKRKSSSEKGVGGRDRGRD